MILDHPPNSVVIIHEQDGRHRAPRRERFLDPRIVGAKSQFGEHRAGFDHSFQRPPHQRPNATMADLHDRMPVILEPSD
jgi:hypothetical protein